MKKLIKIKNIQILRIKFENIKDFSLKENKILNKIANPI